MADKFYLTGTFSYREDVLENWINHNPVLEKGEPSIVRDGADGEWLKIGDGVTAWNDLPYRKGPKGDKGADGAQGPQGEAGKDAITDQTYNPDSLNAQSGVAVAQAVNKPWQLIYGTTLTEPITQLQINNDQYPDFKEIHIEALILPTDTTLSAQIFYVGLQGYNLWHGQGNPKATKKIYWMADLCLTPDNGISCDGDMSSYFWTKGDWNYRSFGYYYLDETRNYYTIYDAAPYIILRTDITDGMGVGTKIRIWGR